MKESLTLQYVRGEISTEEYWSATFVNFCFKEHCYDDSWNEKLRSAVNSAFWEMHALDRSDPFWRNTNLLATDNKLMEFADYKLHSSPEDIDAALLKIAVRLHFGQGHLDSHPWKILFAAGVADLRFLLHSAYIDSRYWGGEHIYATACLIQELGFSVRTELNWLASKGPAEATWTRRLEGELSALPNS